MIGHTVLGKIVGPPFFAACSRADLTFAVRGILLSFLLLHLLQETGTENLQGLVLVLLLTASILATDDHASREMHDLDGGISRIDSLPARTSRATNLNS